jgi:hypothetical protein
MALSSIRGFHHTSATAIVKATGNLAPPGRGRSPPLPIPTAKEGGGNHPYRGTKEASQEAATGDAASANANATAAAATNNHCPRQHH